MTFYVFRGVAAYNVLIGSIDGHFTRRKYCIVYDSVCVVLFLLVLLLLLLLLIVLLLLCICVYVLLTFEFPLGRWC